MFREDTLSKAFKAAEDSIDRHERPFCNRLRSGFYLKSGKNLGGTCDKVSRSRLGCGKSGGWDEEIDSNKPKYSGGTSERSCVHETANRETMVSVVCNLSERS